MKISTNGTAEARTEELRVERLTATSTWSVPLSFCLWTTSKKYLVCMESLARQQARHRLQSALRTHNRSTVFTQNQLQGWKLIVRPGERKQTNKKLLHFQVVTTERTLEIHGIFLVAQQPNSNLNAYLHCWCIFSLCVCAATDNKTNVQLQQIAATVWLMCSILFIYMIWQCSTHQTGLEVWLEYLLNSPGAVHSAPV